MCALHTASPTTTAPHGAAGSVLHRGMSASQVGLVGCRMGGGGGCAGGGSAVDAVCGGCMFVVGEGFEGRCGVKGEAGGRRGSQGMSGSSGVVEEGGCGGWKGWRDGKGWGAGNPTQGMGARPRFARRGRRVRANM